MAKKDEVVRLKIDDYDDRMTMVGILASAGYTVSIKYIKTGTPKETSYWVIVGRGPDGETVVNP